MPTLNPFLYGKPVPPDRLFGRQNAVRTVFSRLQNRESTAIVGEPHIGKTSVLRYLADEEVRSEWLSNTTESYLFMDVDCHLLSAGCIPQELWQRVVDAAKGNFVDDNIRHQCEIIEQSNFGSFALESFFRFLGKKGWCIVLLLDEFDVLLNHPNFNTSDFMGTLRSLATRTDGLVVITASRISVAHMNRKSQEINPHGSPFFNNVTEVRILPLTQAEAEQLIRATLSRVEEGLTFTPGDENFLISLAGRHPYLLQMAAASLYDALVDDNNREVGCKVATRLFHERSDAHFEDFWRHLTPTEQRALLLLALAQYRGYVDGREFNLDKVGQLEWYDPDLRHLRDIGIIETVHALGSVPWREENWRIAVGGFVPWLMDNIISGTREAKDFGEWLQDREFQGLFTREESTKLKEIASKIPKGAIDITIEFTKSLLLSK